MKITISFDTNNAAFEDFDDECDLVLTRALKVITQHAKTFVEGDITTQFLRDTNGNRIGTVTMSV